jgi:hypothetical protein
VDGDDRFAFLGQSLMICWYGLRRRRRHGPVAQAQPLVASKGTPSAADMHAALSDALIQARINASSPRQGQAPKISDSTPTSDAHAA